MGGWNTLEQQVSSDALQAQCHGHVGVLEERAQLGSEHEGVRAGIVVERLLAHAVAGQKEVLAGAIPEREGEHPVEVTDALRPRLLVGVHDHFGVRARAESVSAPLEPVAQGGEVVNFSVQHDPDGPILVRDRLLPAGQIDHGEPTDAERNMIVDVRALVVRPPMAQRRRHPAQYLTTILSRSIHHEPGDSAHGRCTQARGQERRWKPTGSEK